MLHRVDDFEHALYHHHCIANEIILGHLILEETNISYRRDISYNHNHRQIMYVYISPNTTNSAPSSCDSQAEEASSGDFPWYEVLA